MRQRLSIFITLTIALTVLLLCAPVIALAQSILLAQKAGNQPPVVGKLTPPPKEVTAGQEFEVAVEASDEESLTLSLKAESGGTHTLEVVAVDREGKVSKPAKAEHHGQGGEPAAGADPPDPAQRGERGPR